MSFKFILPELVASRILRLLKIARNDVVGFKQQLSLLAVCQQWRQITLPWVYRDMFIYGQPTKDSLCLVSNAELLKPYRLLVKGLKVNVRHQAALFHQVLGQFLQHLSTDPTGLPPDYHSKLVLAEVPNVEFEEEEEEEAEEFHIFRQSRVMNEELLGVMSKVVGDFAKHFTNVTQLDITILSSSGTAAQLTKALLEAFDSQLRIFKCRIHAPFSITRLPTNLTKLDFTCHYMSSPRVMFINPLPLESLCLRNIPNLFSWRQCFLGTQDTTDKPIVLPNLKHLMIAHSQNIDLEHFAKIAGHSEPVWKSDNPPEPLQTPALKSLYIRSRGYCDSIIALEKVPSHLDTVELVVDGETICQMDNMPVHSIGTLHLSTCRDPCLDGSEQIYRAANHWFEQIETRNAYANLGDIYREEWKAQLMDWRNVTTLALDSMESNELVSLLSKLPMLQNIQVHYIILHADDELRLFQLETLLAGSCLKSLHTNTFKKDVVGRNFNQRGQRDGEEIVIDFITMLSKSLKSLVRLSCFRFMASSIHEKIVEAKGQYPHLEHLEICPF